MSFLDLLKFTLAMLLIAGCGYGSAVAVFHGGLWLLGDSVWVRVIIGPLSVFAGLAGMIGIPGGIALVITKKRSKRGE